MISRFICFESSREQCWSWARPSRFGTRRRRGREKAEFFDGIVAIKILIQIARIRENERQQSARHNLWFLLAYLVMAKRLIGNLSKLLSPRKQTHGEGNRSRRINSVLLSHGELKPIQICAAAVQTCGRRGNRRSLRSLCL